MGDLKNTLKAENSTEKDKNETEKNNKKTEITSKKNIKISEKILNEKKDLNNTKANLNKKNNSKKTQKNQAENNEKKSKKNKEENNQKKLQKNDLNQNNNLNNNQINSEKNVAVQKNIIKNSFTNTASLKEKNNLNTQINNSEKNTDKTNKNQQNKKILIKYLIIFIIILFIFLFFSLIFSLTTSRSDKIISGVSVNNIDLSGLTKKEAIEKLNSELSPNLITEINVNHNDYSKKLETNSFGASYAINSSVESAYNVGRNKNNIFLNNYSIIFTYLKKSNITPEVTFDSDLLIEKINEINDELPDRVINSNYEIKDNSLVVSNSSNGYRIQNEQFKVAICQALSENINSIEIPVEEYQANKVNIDAIYEAVHKEPVDATFKTNPYEIIKEENGLDFAISIEDARKMVSQEQDSYTIPLKVLTPKVTVKTLPAEAFPDALSTYSTTYASSNYNRSVNISLATKSINGCVLMPGESLSYNETVGQRTPARGYKEAGVYVNGEVSTDYGGGICQVSSTLYNAVLLTNLEIVERTNHTFEPSYVPAGQDATVSWKSPDFVFKNNRNYPIKIIASAGNGHIQVTINGLKSDDDYEVKIVSSKTGTIPFSTEYKDDSNLPAGTTKVTQAGSNGCKSQTYKILYKNGNEISRTLLNSDTYKPHNQVIVRGTKVVATPQPETPPNSSQQPVEENNSSDITVTTDSIQ